MLLITVEIDFIIQRIDRSVHTGAHKAGLTNFLEDRLISSFASTHDRRENQNSACIGKRFDGIHNFLRGLLHHFSPTNWTMRNSGARVKQAEVIIDFGHGSHCRARIVRRAFLVNGYCRRESVNVIHIGLIHLTEELTRIRRKRFNIASLTFSKDGVECQRGFARTG